MAASTTEGVVSAFLIKPARHEPMEPVPDAAARGGHGIIGDCHAQPLGPRQVLIVREEALEGLDVAPWQVRANIATQGIGEEALRSGSVLRIGDSARIRVTHECEVCKVLRKYVSGESFRSLPRRRGSLGVFLTGGPMNVGDAIHLETERYPEVPDGIYDRLAWVVHRIPNGKVVTYDLLVALVGSPRAYFRVLPTYLKRARRAGLPAHRVLTSGRELSRHLPDQLDELRAEGVAINSGKLADERHIWDAESLYSARAQ